MSKSALVMVTPRTCNSCDLCGGTLHTFCKVNLRDIENLSEKPDWCSLRLLPEKDDWNDPYDEYYTGYANGWNRCLEEITEDGKVL